MLKVKCQVIKSGLAFKKSKVKSLIKSCNQSPRLVFKSLKSFNDQSSNQSRWQIFPPPAGAGSSTLRNENQISIRNNKNYQISCEVSTSQSSTCAFGWAKLGFIIFFLTIIDP